MREEDRQILEEAIRNSAGGEDFDEMLLRATKKHLPRKYHRQFSVILEEILTEADQLGVSNRSAAQSLARKATFGAAAAAMPVAAPSPPVALAPPAKRPDPAVEILSRHLRQAPAAEKTEAAGGPAAVPAPVPEKAAPREPGPENPGAEAPAQADPEALPPDGSVERLPEEQKILDLGGTSPESLSPELQDKLKKLVKAQKRKQAWEEASAEEEPVPGLFFKGQQRAPPFVPLTKPAKPETADTGPAGKKPKDEDEEDLDGTAQNDA